MFDPGILQLRLRVMGFGFRRVCWDLGFEGTLEDYWPLLLHILPLQTLDKPFTFNIVLPPRPETLSPEL